MDYEKQEREFYELIEKKKEEIKSLDISDDEKNKLYKLVDDTIELEENIPRDIGKPFIDLGNAFGKIYSEVKNITPITKKTLSNLEETVAKQRIKKKLFPKNIIPFSNN